MIKCETVYDFWEDSSLDELNAATFGRRTLRFENDDGVPQLSGAAPLAPLKPVRDRLQATLAKRRSGRSFAGEPLDQHHVTRLLASVGRDTNGRRLIPSAGGLNAVQTFGIGGNNIDKELRHVQCGPLTVAVSSQSNCDWLIKR